MNSTTERRRPIVAALLTFIAPGLGHVYSGQVTQGFFFYLKTLLVTSALLFSWGLLVRSFPSFWTVALGTALYIVPFLYLISIACRAYSESKRSGVSYQFKPCNKWYVYASYVVVCYFVSALVTYAARASYMQAYRIPSGTMIPTLEIGDDILVDKLAYGIRIPFLERYLVDFKRPRRGDVIVFIFPEDRSKDFIKRVIAVGGDTVTIKRKKIFINGEQVEDPHAHFEGEDPQVAGLTGSDYGPKTVPENHMFVLGDNRDRSYDSRFWGFLHLEDVKGKAFLIYYAEDAKTGDIRWSRIGSRIE
jgi:signal peptidase I